MALEINAQYTLFVQFAQQQADAEHSKVIARVGGEGPLGGRGIKAAERGEGDSVRPFLPRSGTNKNKNDAVDQMILDPNVENPHAKYGEALGEPFAFRTDNSKVSCTSSYKITIA